MVLRFDKQTKDVSPLKTLLGFECFRGKPRILFEYSFYENGLPGTGKTLSRDINSTNDFLNFYEGLEDCINNRLSRTKELAMHSKVKIGNQIFHIPLIDFALPDEHDITLFAAIEALQEDFNFDLYLFKSGRSFHGYMDGLLEEEDWHKFLGKLVLLNKVNNPSIIDNRWVGHSLRQGFSSLRLSCNTLYYLDYPKLWKKVPKSV